MIRCRRRRNGNYDELSSQLLLFSPLGGFETDMNFNSKQFKSWSQIWSKPRCKELDNQSIFRLLTQTFSGTGAVLTFPQLKQPAAGRGRLGRLQPIFYSAFCSLVQPVFSFRQFWHNRRAPSAVFTGYPPESFLSSTTKLFTLMRSAWLLAVVLVLLVSKQCANAMVEDTALALHKNCRFLIVCLNLQFWNLLI